MRNRRDEDAVSSVITIKYPLKVVQVINQVQSRPALKTKRPYDPTNNRERGYKFLWAVYPDYWKDSWGQKPLLGFVRADTEYDAVYAAYDKGLSHPNNCTFGLELVRQERPIDKPFKRITKQ